MDCPSPFDPPVTTATRLSNRKRSIPATCLSSLCCGAQLGLDHVHLTIIWMPHGTIADGDCVANALVAAALPSPVKEPNPARRAEVSQCKPNTKNASWAL